MTDSRQEDRTMLGEPPWKPTAPALIDWESAHGHDVRLDCSLDGCNVLVADYLAAVEALETALGHQWEHDINCGIDALRPGANPCNCGVERDYDEASAALARLRESVPA